MLIGILTTGHAPDALRPETGDYPHLFKQLLAGQGLAFHDWNVVDMEFPASIHEADGWLLTGSRHGAYEDHPFIAPLEEFIREVYAAAVPMVGICFGHQIIAQALGGKVEKSPRGWQVGRQEYYFDGEKLALNAWHQDQVVVKPPQAEVCATSESCDFAALIYGKRAYSVQAHPEFDSSFVEGLIDKRGRGVVPDALLDAATDRLAAANDNAAIAARIGAFFRQEAAQ